jgi:PhnB protein
MSAVLSPYLSFAGNARQAMEFYESVFGGELLLTTFGQFGMDMPGVDPDQIMHGQLNAAKGFVLMGSDTPPDMQQPGGASITVCLSGTDIEDLRGYFEALGEGAEVSMPLQKQVWGDYYGQLTDRFGIPWMANISAEQTPPS